MPTAIVTGGGGALGKGICTSLVADGWTVVVADMIEAHARETVDALGGAPRAAVEILDVNDLAAVQRVFAEVAREYPDLAALVNAAGGTLALRVPTGDLVENLPEHWDRMIAVNLFGTFNCCHTIAPLLKTKGGGAVVSVASGAGYRGGPPHSRQSGAAVYAATKAGVIAFTQSLAQELGPFGIRVNAVAPGRNESRDKPLAKMLEMQAKDESQDPLGGRRSPLGRFGTPADVGDAVSFLLSPKARYFTGSCIDVTGGIRLQ